MIRSINSSIESFEVEVIKIVELTVRLFMRYEERTRSLGLKLTILKYHPTISSINHHVYIRKQFHMGINIIKEEEHLRCFY